MKLKVVGNQIKKAFCVAFEIHKPMSVIYFDEQSYGMECVSPCKYCGKKLIRDGVGKWHIEKGERK